MPIHISGSEWPWPFDKLSPRQKETAVLMLEGIRYQEIAARLGCSPKTIDVHRREVFRKTQVDSLVGLVYLAIGTGLVEVPVVTNTPAPVALVAPEAPTVDTPAQLTDDELIAENVVDDEDTGSWQYVRTEDDEEFEWPEGLCPPSGDL